MKKKPEAAKKVKVVDINPVTQRELKALMQQTQGIEDKIHYTIRIYADAIGEQGPYTLSKDCTKLVFGG